MREREDSGGKEREQQRERERESEKQRVRERKEKERVKEKHREIAGERERDKRGGSIEDNSRQKTRVLIFIQKVEISQEKQTLTIKRV